MKQLQLIAVALYLSISVVAANNLKGEMKKTAVVYTGGAGDGSSVADTLKDANWNVVFVGQCTPPTKCLSLKDALKKTGKDGLYVQPGGGDDLVVGWNFVKHFRKDLKNWVSEGGHYLGICMGAYLADNLASLDDFKKAKIHPAGFDFTEDYVQTMDYKSQPNSGIADTKDYVLDTMWQGHAKKVYFQNGPSFIYKDGIADAEKKEVINMGTYPNGDMQAVVIPSKKGGVAVLGTHPEIEYNNVYQPAMFMSLVNKLMKE